MIELQAPNKEQRYELLKSEIAAHFATKELQLQKMAQQTEYFLAKDLFYLWENRDQDFTALVNEYKAAVFPDSKKATESAPCWVKDIGGLQAAKQTVTEMFGIT